MNKEANMKQLNQNVVRKKILQEEVGYEEQKLDVTRVAEKMNAHLEQNMVHEQNGCLKEDTNSDNQEHMPLIRGAKYELVRGVEYDELVRGVEYDNLVRGVEYDDLPVDDMAGKDKVQAHALSNSEPLKQEQVVNDSVQDMFYTMNFSKQETVNGFNEDSKNNNSTEMIITAVSTKNDDISEEIVVKKQLLNFTLELVRKIIKVVDMENCEGHSCYYVVRICVITKNGSIRTSEATVDSTKIKEFDWVTKETHSLATVPREKYEKIEFQDKVQKCIETEDVPFEIIYPNVGWRNIRGIGFRYVYGDGIVGEENTLIHSISGKYSLNLKKELLGTMEVFKKALGMLQICGNGRTSESLFLFTHASVLTTLFEQAGFPICFVYGITGVTNSRKTSLALAMAKIFDRKNAMVADAEFATATACGIEKVLSTYKDGVVIIDDFKPGVNQGQQRMMDQKLDQLVRFYGNRVSKKRMLDFNSDLEQKYFPINGGCVLTMEVVTGVLSSISRMYLTEITNDDVDNGRLLYYQNNLWILPTHLYDFIGWVTNNFDYVVERISELCIDLRKTDGFKIPRYAEMYATMMTTAIIFSEYAMAKGFWDDEYQKEFLAYIEKSLISEFQIMQRKITKRDKAYVVVEALKEYVTRVCPLFLTAETCMKKCDCYEDEKIIYIRSQALRKIVNEYCKLYGETCQIINDDELYGLLERIQVLDIADKGKSRERGRKLPTQRGNHYRYIYILKDMIFKEFD